MRINLELLDLRAFLAVFDLGSFHKAATHLNLSQPALSRRVQALEEKLDLLLFERTTRHVAPTASARQLEPMARRLLEELDSSLQSIGGLGDRHSGPVTISSIPTAAVYFLPRVIGRFAQRYPDVRFRVLDRSPQEVLECVMRGEVEYGINMLGATETGLTFTHLLDDPYVLACNRDHPFAKRKYVSWHDLATQRLIRIGRANSGNRALLDEALAKARLDLDWRYEVNNLTTSLGLVEAGLGLSVLPRLATQQGQSSIVIKPIRSPVVTRSIGIVERQKARLSPAAKYFRDMLLAGWGPGSRARD